MKRYTITVDATRLPRELLKPWLFSWEIRRGSWSGVCTIPAGSRAVLERHIDYGRCRQLVLDSPEAPSPRVLCANVLPQE